jgi:hypothetical protein
VCRKFGRELSSPIKSVIGPGLPAVEFAFKAVHSFFKLARWEALTDELKFSGKQAVQFLLRKKKTRVSHRVLWQTRKRLTALASSQTSPVVAVSTNEDLSGIRGMAILLGIQDGLPVQM